MFCKYWQARPLLIGVLFDVIRIRCYGMRARVYDWHVVLFLHIFICCEHNLLSPPEPGSWHFEEFSVPGESALELPVSTRAHAAPRAQDSAHVKAVCAQYVLLRNRATVSCSVAVWSVQPEGSAWAETRAPARPWCWVGLGLKLASH